MAEQWGQFFIDRTLEQRPMDSVWCLKQKMTCDDFECKTTKWSALLKIHLSEFYWGLRCLAHYSIFFLGALKSIRCKDKYVQAVNIIRQVVAHTRTRVQTTCSVQIHFFLNFVIFGSSALAFSTDIYIILLVSEPSVERIDHFIYWSVSLFFSSVFSCSKKELSTTTELNYNATVRA